MVKFGGDLVKLCIEVAVSSEAVGRELVAKFEALRPFVSGLGAVDVCECDECLIPGRRKTKTFVVMVWVNTVQVITALGQTLGTAT